MRRCPGGMTGIGCLSIRKSPALCNTTARFSTPSIADIVLALSRPSNLRRLAESTDDGPLEEERFLYLAG